MVAASTFTSRCTSNCGVFCGAGPWPSRSRARRTVSCSLSVAQTIRFLTLLSIVKRALGTSDCSEVTSVPASAAVAKPYSG